MSISYQDAFHRILDLADRLRASSTKCTIREVDVSQALGYTSHERTVSATLLPPYDNSAMDGYAVSHEETTSASCDKPVQLRIVGSIAAGDLPPTYPSVHAVPALSCWRINTGAPFPRIIGSRDGDGEARHYDACARVEIVRMIQDRPGYIELTEPVHASQHRRLAGEDFQPDMVILDAQEIVGPGQIAALTSNGIKKLRVYSKPKIAVLTTGKEVANPSSDEHSRGDIQDGRIHNSNGPYIEAALKDSGYSDVTWIANVGDDPDDFKIAVRDVRSDYDVLITTGGVSKGQHDYVRDSLIEMGADILFHGVRIRPGHPVLVALFSEGGPGKSSLSSTGLLPVFSLPGNPIAAAASLRFIVIPFLRHLTGRRKEVPNLRARLQAPATVRKGNFPKKACIEERQSIDAHLSVTATKHTSFFLAQYKMSPDLHSSEVIVELLARGSGLVRQLSEANCWAVLREGQNEQEGRLLDCFPLHRV